MNENKANQSSLTEFPRQKTWIAFFLVAATLITYMQVFSFGFLTYDTSVYVTENTKVQAGLTTDNIKWALTTNFFSNWHPLTWMSHMLDIEIWGTNPVGHHATNLFFHICNSLLLFIVFLRLTGKTWESGLLAGLFALHPLHIESVAWIAERKDVLSTFFFLLSILSYIYYVQLQNLRRYSLLLLMFILALMTKPMVVTLPVVLLLLDYWPLGRHRYSSNDKSEQSQLTSNPILSILLEKIPLFLLSAISSWLTILAQRANMTTMDSLPLSMRLANSLTAYLDYIWKTFWPVNLAVLYPHPGMPHLAQILTSLFVLFCISFVAFKCSKTQPWFIVGWLWFLGMLVPVIGILQVGHQAMADRYTYVPHIGFFLIVSWGISGFLHLFSIQKKVFAYIAFILLLCCSTMSWHQLHYWKNDITLFRRATEVTENNYIAENNIGLQLLVENKLDEAEPHFIKSIQYNPSYDIAYTNLAQIFSRKGKTREAIEMLRIALDISPNSLIANFGLASELSKNESNQEATYYYRKIIAIKPDFITAYINLGELLLKLGNADEALAVFEQILSIKPDNKAALQRIDELQKLQKK